MGDIQVPIVFIATKTDMIEVEQVCIVSGAPIPI